MSESNQTPAVKEVEAVVAEQASNADVPYSEVLKNQQEVLKAAGFYQGEIDGWWGPKTREAMIAFSCVDNAGNENGEPFTGSRVPNGYKLVNHFFVALSSEEKPQKSEVSQPEQTQQSEQTQQPEQTRQTQQPKQTGKFHIT